MESKLPGYIQRRIDINNIRIKEIKNILMDEDSVELYSEMVFLKKENISLMTTNFEIQTYEVPIYGTEPANVDVESIKESKIDYSVVDINLASHSGSEKEELAKKEYQIVNLYQIEKPSKEEEYIDEDDLTFLKRHGIKFINGLPVGIDIERTPKFVLNRIARINIYDRLLTGENLTSDFWSATDKIEKTYFESEINEDTFKDLKIDYTIEDRKTARLYKDKEFVLIQIKPDYTVSNDYRYSIMVKPDSDSDFYEKYKKLFDKSREYGITTYKEK